MRYLASLVTSALLFMLLSVIYGIEVFPLYGSVLISFLASSLLTSVVVLIMSMGIVITLGGAFYVIAGKAGASVSILFSLVILYIAQFNLMQYFGEKFAWYPSFSDGQLVLYFVVSLILGLLLGASNKKN